jgi:hypothetical protein
MNRFLEYLALIPKGIPNISFIIEGIITNVELKYKILSENSKNEIIKRRLTCLYCPFNNKKAKNSEEYFKLTTYHYTSNRKDKHCSFCGCPIDIKTASLSSNCGIETWNDQNPSNTIELKWKKYVE